MELPGRQYSSTNGYRYGFNGKEQDKEVVQYDYGFRIYDARLARFKSVDPLSSNYPWNSAYAFAENDFIRSIDLDGLERVITAVFGVPGNGTPGEAVITIKKTFFAVTAGSGAMNVSYLNSAEFRKLAAKGDGVLNLKTFPANGNQAVEASPADMTAGNFYKAKVMYDYNLIVNPNLTINDAMAEVHKDNVENGILFNEITRDQIQQVADGFIANHIAPVRNTETDDYYRFPYMANKLIDALNNPASEDARAAGSNESFNNVAYNMIIWSKDYSARKTGNDLSNGEDILHESAHNDAASNSHANPHYNYKKTGTQSNQSGYVYPTKQNTMDLINDPTNSKNSKVIFFDINKLKSE